MASSTPTTGRFPATQPDPDTGFSEWELMDLFNEEVLVNVTPLDDVDMDVTPGDEGDKPGDEDDKPKEKIPKLGNNTGGLPLL